MKIYIKGNSRVLVEKKYPKYRFISRLDLPASIYAGRKINVGNDEQMILKKLGYHELSKTDLKSINT